MNTRQTYLGLVLIFWLLSGGVSIAQHDFAYYDKETYALYQQKKWSELLPLAKEALRAGYDYAYLRMRLGIAYYELRKYQLAVPQFYKAHAFNRNDPLNQEYLYYSLLFSGRTAEARHFAGKFDQEKAQPTSPALLNLFSFATFKNSDQRTLVRNMRSYAIGVQHGLGRSMVLKHTYGNLRQNFVEKVTTEINPGNGNGPGREITKEVPYYLDQQEYQFEGFFQFSRGWQLGAGYQYLWRSDPENPFHERAYRFHFIKSFPHLKLSTGLGYSNFSSTEQKQIGLSLVLYPLANTDLYYQAAGIVKEEKQTRYQWWSHRIGVNMAPNTWLEGIAEFGEMADFQDWINGFSYNISDPIRSRFGANLQYWIQAKHLIFLQYQLENKRLQGSELSFRHHMVTLGVNLKLL